MNTQRYVICFKMLRLHTRFWCPHSLFLPKVFSHEWRMPCDWYISMVGVPPIISWYGGAKPHRIVGIEEVMNDCFITVNLCFSSMLKMREFGWVLRSCIGRWVNLRDTQAPRLIVSIPLIQRRETCCSCEGKAPSRSGFSPSTYVVLKTRHVNPNIHVRRY